MTNFQRILFYCRFLRRPSHFLQRALLVRVSWILNYNKYATEHCSRFATRGVCGTLNKVTPRPRPGLFLKLTLNMPGITMRTDDNFTEAAANLKERSTHGVCQLWQWDALWLVDVLYAIYPPPKSL